MPSREKEIRSRTNYFSFINHEHFSKLSKEKQRNHILYVYIDASQHLLLKNK